MKVQTKKRFKRLMMQSKSAMIASELQKEGKEVVYFGGGDPVLAGFHPPQHILDALVDAIRDGWNMYPANAANTELALKTAISKRETKIHETKYPINNIVLTDGVTGSINLLFSVLEPGNELLVPEPTYHAYLTFAEYYRCTTVPYQAYQDRNWLPDPDELRSKISQKTVGILLINPNNPTGAVYSEKILKGFLEVAGEYGLPIISDEIYDLTTFDGIRVKSIASIAQDIPCIIMNGLTKNYFVPGWRIGYMCFHDPEEKISKLRERLTKFSQFVQLVPTPIRIATISALQGSLDHLTKALPILEHRRDFTWKRLNEINGITCTKPQGGYFVFPHVRAIGKIWNDDEDFLRDLVKEEQIRFRPGSLFGEGCWKYFRSHFLNSIETLSDIYDRLESFMKRHS